MRPGAYPVWLSLNLASAFMESLVWTVVYVYYVTVVELNPFELVLVGTVMETAVFLFEVPTGVVADTYSRRLSIVISFAVVGVSYAVVAATGAVPWILAANVLLGIGLTFSSGALQAWVTDEVGGEDLERVFLAGSRISYVGALLGIGGSVALALVDIRLAIAAGAAVSVAIAVALALVMPERGFVPQRHDNVAALRGVARNALHGFRTVRASATLLVIVVITLFFGASTEALDRLTEAQFIRSVGLPGDLRPVVWFGLISVIGLVSGFLLATYLLRRLKPTQPVRTVEILLATDVVLAVALLVFAFAESFWLALLAYLVARRARDRQLDRRAIGRDRPGGRRADARRPRDVRVVARRARRVGCAPGAGTGALRVRTPARGRRPPPDPAARRTGRARALKFSNRGRITHSSGFRGPGGCL